MEDKGETTTQNEVSSDLLTADIRRRMGGGSAATQSTQSTSAQKLYACEGGPVELWVQEQQQRHVCRISIIVFPNIFCQYVLIRKNASLMSRASANP